MPADAAKDARPSLFRLSPAAGRGHASDKNVIMAGLTRSLLLLHFSDRLSRAFALALRVHDGQKRTGTDIPYIVHPLDVCRLVIARGGSERQACAALLHDAAEDGGEAWLEAIRSEVGEDVLELVLACTDEVAAPGVKKQPWRDRKLAHLARMADPQAVPDEAILVLSADKLSNLTDIFRDAVRIGDEVYQRFTARKEGTLWYYGRLAEVLKGRGSPLADKLAELLRKVETLPE